MRSARTTAGAMGACVASVRLGARRQCRTGGGSLVVSARRSRQPPLDRLPPVAGASSSSPSSRPRRRRPRPPSAPPAARSLDVTEEAGRRPRPLVQRRLPRRGPRPTAAISGAARNHSVGTTRPGMPHRFADERPRHGRPPRRQRPTGHQEARRRVRAEEPLADLQWDMDMIGATPDGAWRKATGQGVTVGIIDTGSTPATRTWPPTSPVR